MQVYEIKDIPEVKWHALASKKIFFGHQSVGFNIIDGMRDIMQQNPQIKLNIVETRKVADIKDGVFAHARIGENTKPETKIDDFVSIIEQKPYGEFDAAFMKLCYVDVSKQTDIKLLFKHYKSTMQKLHAQHPELTIIHCTMPLKTQDITWKTRIKSLLGKDAWEFAENIKRNEFNKLLLDEYKDKEPVFDLALYESTGPDGARTTFENKGVRYYAMFKEYSNDGGHLNKIGRKYIAEQFLVFLATNI